MVVWQRHYYLACWQLFRFLMSSFACRSCPCFWCFLQSFFSTRFFFLILMVRSIKVNIDVFIYLIWYPFLIRTSSSLLSTFLYVFLCCWSKSYHLPLFHLSKVNHASDQFCFICDYHLSISSQPCYSHLLYNAYHPTSSEIVISRAAPFLPASLQHPRRNILWSLQSIMLPTSSPSSLLIIPLPSHFIPDSPHFIWHFTPLTRPYVILSSLICYFHILSSKQYNMLFILRVSFQSKQWLRNFDTNVGTISWRRNR